jgi:hypothetical protein
MWALASGKLSKAKAVGYIMAQILAGVFVWVMGSMLKV